MPRMRIGQLLTSRRPTLVVLGTTTAHTTQAHGGQESETATLPYRDAISTTTRALLSYVRIPRI